MYEWSPEHQAIAAVVRRFVDEEVRPHLDDLEHNGVPPYAIMRRMYDVFGLKEMAGELRSASSSARWRAKPDRASGAASTRRPS
jgi:hypothetical protein